MSAMLAQAGAAGQAIVVTAPSLNTSTATLTAYSRTAGTWTAAFGPWPARIGNPGFAPAGEKREGDERTPSGAYGFEFMFGVDADPGVKFPYFQVTPSIVWVDDPTSPLYNQWVDRSQQAVTASVEQMYQPLAYRHGAVIAYNSARTPNLGSAIFLHASTGSATAGCVSLPVDLLIQVLKWLDPAQNPRIVMGVG
ncbi:MAG: L,D-transpeptidase family protein [Acidimicrobiales bacterium]